MKMSKNNGTPTAQEQAQIIEEQDEIDRLLSEFIQWQIGYDAIHPNDKYNQDIYIEFTSQDVLLAINYINDHDIDIDELVYPGRANSSSIDTNKRLEKIEHLLLSNDYSSGIKLISKSLTELLAEYLEEKNISAKPSTLTAYKDNICLFIEVVGDKKSNELTKVDINKYISKLTQIPSHRNKKSAYRDKSLSQILSMTIPQDDLLSPKSLSSHTTNINTFLSWAVKHGYIKEGSNQALNGAFSKSDYNLRLPFEDSELNQLFNIVINDITLSETCFA